MDKNHKGYIAGGFLLVAVIVATAYFLWFFPEEQRQEKGNKYLTEEELVDVYMIVNGNYVTYERLDRYVHRISRDRFDEDLSREELRENAKEKIIEEVVLEDFFSKNEIIITEEEIHDRYTRLIQSIAAVETREDYFSYREDRGFSRDETENYVERLVRNEKLIDAYINDYRDDLEPTEDDIHNEYQKYYEEQKKIGADMENILVFENVKEDIRLYLLRRNAVAKANEDFEEMKERADIVFLE